MKTVNLYEYIVVESFIPESTAGLHGKVHIRPEIGQKYDQSLHVRCSKELSENYPVSTKFIICLYAHEFPQSKE